MPGKVYFWAGRLLLKYQNELESGKAVDVTSESKRKLVKKSSKIGQYQETLKSAFV